MDNFEYLKENFGVSRETYKKLAEYVELLIAKNSNLNLIGPATIENIWQRHIIDSIQLANFIEKNEEIIDFGSGAGLPGIILAIMGYKVISVESIAKKANFQQEMKEILQLDNLEIINKRIEDVRPKEGKIITARAVASLDKLFRLSQSHLKIAKKIIFMKGKNYQKELIEAQKKWHFNYKSTISITSKESVILEISDLSWKL